RRHTTHRPAGADHHQPAGWPAPAEPAQPGRLGRAGGPPEADAAVWAALIQAGPAGTAVPDLVTTTGLSRATLYRPIQTLRPAGPPLTAGSGHWPEPATPNRPATAAGAPPHPDQRSHPR